MNAENFLKRSQEAKMSSNDSGGLPRLHFGQCTPPLLLSKWTVVNQSLLKHDSLILLGIQMKTKITSDAKIYSPSLTDSAFRCRF